MSCYSRMHNKVSSWTILRLGLWTWPYLCFLGEFLPSQSHSTFYGHGSRLCHTLIFELKDPRSSYIHATHQHHNLESDCWFCANLAFGGITKHSCLFIV